MPDRERARELRGSRGRRSRPALQPRRRRRSTRDRATGADRLGRARRAPARAPIPLRPGCGRRGEAGTRRPERVDGGRSEPRRLALRDLAGSGAGHALARPRPSHRRRAAWPVRLRRLAGGATTAACSRRAASARRTVVWSVARRKIVKLLGPSGPMGVSGVAFSPDDELVATAGIDGRLRVYALRTGRIIGNVQVKGSLQDIAFTPDGKRVATAGLAGEIAIWDVAADLSCGRSTTRTRSSRSASRRTARRSQRATRRERRVLGSDHRRPARPDAPRTERVGVERDVRAERQRAGHDRVPTGTSGCGISRIGEARRRTRYQAPTRAGGGVLPERQDGLSRCSVRAGRRLERRSRRLEGDRRAASHTATSRERSGETSSLNVATALSAPEHAPAASPVNQLEARGHDRAMREGCHGRRLGQASAAAATSRRLGSPA